MKCCIIYHVILYTIFRRHQTSKEQGRSSLFPLIRPFFLKSLKEPAMLHCLLLQELCCNSTAWILKGNLHKREILLTFFSDIHKTPASPFHTFIFRISLLHPEKEQTYEFLKSSGQLCPIRDWIFCIYFFFFWKYIVFEKKLTQDSQLLFSQDV